MKKITKEEIAYLRKRFNLPHATNKLVVEMCGDTLALDLFRLDKSLEAAKESFFNAFKPIAKPVLGKLAKLLK